jgi:nicotinate-nucleotide adenylyltransferase
MPIARLPLNASRMTIGLFGGSFNPPHDGHRLVTLTALKRLGLDRIWWIVTPGNPLKDTSNLLPLYSRIAACRTLMPEPKIDITGFEKDIGTRYTLDTLRYLKRRCPAVQFIWIMGTDNLVQFHNWQGWRDIARLMPIAIIDRPGTTLKATSSPAAQALHAARWPEFKASLIKRAKAPALIFLHGKRSKLSSTVLRKEQAAKSS